MDPTDPPTPGSGGDARKIATYNEGGTRIVACIWMLSGVALFFLIARCYCKYLRHRGLWWDDFVLIASWACITAECVLLTHAVTLGYGYRIAELPPRYYPYAFYLLTPINAAGSLSVTAAIWSKTSFALTLLRLTHGWLRHMVWFVILTMNISMGLSALFPWVQCTPIRKSWEPLIEGSCWAPHVLVNYNIFSAAYSAAMDITLALLPWKLTWSLQMQRREKIGVAVAMSCGVFAGITAIVKTTMIPRMASPDPYDGVDLFIWGNAESCVTIVAASIPVLRVLVRDAKASYDEENYGRSSVGRSGRDRRSRPQSHHHHQYSSNTVVVSGGHQMEDIGGEGWRGEGRRGSGVPLRNGSEDDTPDEDAAPGGIVRKHEVVVEYRHRTDGDGPAPGSSPTPSM